MFEHWRLGAKVSMEAFGRTLSDYHIVEWPDGELVCFVPIEFSRPDLIVATRELMDAACKLDGDTAGAAREAISQILSGAPSDWQEWTPAVMEAPSRYGELFPREEVALVHESRSRIIAYTDDYEIARMIADLPRLLAYVARRLKKPSEGAHAEVLAMRRRP